MACILLVSNTGDAHCDFLVEACKRSNTQCFRLNTDKFRLNGNLNWSLDTGEGTLKIGEHQCLLSDVSLIIYRRPSPAHQYRKDIEPWVGKLLDVEWTTLETALSQLVPGKAMNGLAGSSLAQNKIVQLKMALQCNLKVPETIISTNKTYLLEFFNKHPCITKGITNAFSVHNGNLRTGFTTNVSESDLQTYDTQGCPTLLQKAITPHAMWRIVVVGKKIFGFRFNGPSLLLEADSRKVELSLDGKHLTVPAMVQQNLLKMCALLSIEFASADFIEDEHGDLWFLDLNPEGQWAFLEEKFSVRISDAIISLGMVAPSSGD